MINQRWNRANPYDQVMLPIYSPADFILPKGKVAVFDQQENLY